MSIAEKLQTIAENEQRVYEAGQKSMVDESKIIERTATGSGELLVEDVSEIPHDCSLQLSSDSITDFSGVEVTVGGKNLLHYPYNINPSNAKGLTLIDNGNGTYYVSGTATATPSYFSIIVNNIPFPAGGYTFYGVANGSNSTYRVRYMFENQTVDATTEYGIYQIVKADTVLKQVLLIVQEGITVDNLLYLPMILKGNEAYLSFIPPTEQTLYIADSSGKIDGVKSLSPYMRITANENVDVSLSYHKSYDIDRFWDRYQRNGERLDYQAAFTGRGWTSENFRPKYDIKPTTAYMLFYLAQELRINLVERLKEQGVVLDTSKAVSITNLFNGSAITHIGTIDTTGVTNTMAQVFSSSTLQSIDKIILKDDGSSLFATSMFTSAKALVEVRFEGVIACDLQIHWSPLSVESAKNIISCLKNFVTDDPTNANTKTLTFSDDVWTRLEASGTAPDGNTWRHYVTSLGWLN